MTSSPTTLHFIDQKFSRGNVQMKFRIHSSSAVIIQFLKWKQIVLTLECREKELRIVKIPLQSSSKTLERIPKIPTEVVWTSESWKDSWRGRQEINEPVTSTDTLSIETYDPDFATRKYQVLGCHCQLHGLTLSWKLEPWPCQLN